LSGGTEENLSQITWSLEWDLCKRKSIYWKDTILLRIREVQDSNLGWETGYPD
jgi:hypothetical protein